MGRMQKKKPASQKKAKKGAGDSAREGLEQNTAAGSAASGSKGGGSGSGSLEAGSGKQKSVASAARKSQGKSSGDQTFLMKLLDRYFGNWIQFLREVRNELSKVVWPSRREATGMTGVVLVFVLIVSFFLGIIDFGLSSLVRIII